MKRRLDMRGMIGPVGIDTIQASVLYQALVRACGDVEIWRARGRHDGWWYYWLVSRVAGSVRALALVRYSATMDKLQERIERPFGQEMWSEVAAAGGGTESGGTADQPVD